MRTRLNKETALFLVGAALAVLILVKLALFLADRPEAPPTARVPAAALHEGFANLGDDLPVDAIDHCLDAGPRDDPFHDASPHTDIYIRSTVRHRLTAGAVVSEFRFHCLMTPHPLGALRFRLPQGVTLGRVGGPNHDPERSIQRQGNDLIVPVRPLPHHRADHRCTLEIVLTGPLPTRWSVPAVSCTAAMPDVQSETGTLAIQLDLASPIQLIPLTAALCDLTRLTGDAIPPALASEHTRFAYRFRRPDYALALQVQRPAPPLPPDDGRGKTTKKRDDGKKDDVARKKDSKEGPVGPIPEPPTGDPPPGFPLRLMVVYKRVARGERAQAVLRHKGTGELFRGREGDTLYDGVRIVAIANDLVTLTDGTGRRFHCPGRFPIQ